MSARIYKHFSPQRGYRKYVLQSTINYPMFVNVFNFTILVVREQFQVI